MSDNWPQPPRPDIPSASMALKPLPAAERPATRGDIAAVIEELSAIRKVLEQIRDQRT